MVVNGPFDLGLSGLILVLGTWEELDSFWEVLDQRDADEIDESGRCWLF